ncbi:hypothetical protein H4S04_000598 [Coemansia sp. S16]|nr:hypothetical protein H4S04_000598 [Coemansia sp. S16]
MVSTVVERYFATTLHIVFSEIAYYRYLFPDSFFKTVDYENVKVHALIRGKSIESDQLLASVDGACDAMAHRCLKTLVIGLSIHPTKHTFIRELYAFQFGYGPDYKTFKGSSAYNETTELFLQRLTALLREMEVLALPISMSMRMTLTASAPPNYKPPGFASFTTKDIESYAIYPQCGSARVGKASKGKSSMFMCALCVEGPVQTPPLGFLLYPMPMTLDVDEDRQEVVFVAAPTETVGNPHTLCLTCRLRKARIAGDVLGIRRLAKIRKTLFIAHTSGPNTLLWLIKQTLCKQSTARKIVRLLERIGLLKVDRSARPPWRYTSGVVGELSAVPLFSEDIRQVWTAVAEV